jgi:hypothetical protein
MGPKRFLLFAYLAALAADLGVAVRWVAIGMAGVEEVAVL